MNNPDVELCPSRTDLWSKVQYADVSNIQVTKYEPVKYFQPPPDSDDENAAAEPKVEDGEFVWPAAQATC